MQRVHSEDLSNAVPTDDSWTSVPEEAGRVAGCLPMPKKASEDASSQLMRKTSKFHWRCSTCSAENSEAVGNKCGACGTKKQCMEKRDSLSSTQSFTIDDLVQNLEGLEFDVNVDTYNSSSRLTSNAGEWNDSRLASGLWSHQDAEKWGCTTCTFENEPIFCACEMCGQTRPPYNGPASVREDPTVLEQTRASLEAESVKVLQEQRLQELLQYRPVSHAAPPVASAPVVLKPTKNHTRRSISPRRPLSPTPERGPAPKITLADSSLREFFDDVPNIHKRRPLGHQNPDDSAATEATFDMSSSLAGDWSLPEQRLVIYPEEEVETSHQRR